MLRFDIEHQSDFRILSIIRSRSHSAPPHNKRGGALWDRQPLLHDNRSDNRSCTRTNDQVL